MDTKEYTILEPLPGQKAGEKVDVSGLSYFNILYNAALAITVTLAFVMIVLGGIQWSASMGSPGAISDAKKRIYGALIGLVLAFVSWLILNTINTALVNPKLPLAQITSTNGSGAVGAGGGSTESTQAEAVRTSLEQQGVAFLPACSSTRTSNCVSLAGMRVDTINEILALNEQCKSSGKFCKVSITGGTENILHSDGAYSHQGGYKFDADQGPNPALDKLISSYPVVGIRASDNATVHQAPNGTYYADEKSHWDACVKCPPPEFKPA